MAALADVGVYLHFPWCRKRCPYCDFAVETGEPPHASYANAILDELAARADAFPGELVSIYLGGGTPSLWEVAQLARAIAAVRTRYAATPREVTLEANPTDCTPANLEAWQAAGVTRLSIGVQSHDPDELVVLGRDHRFGDGVGAVARVLAHGGFTTSADFILGTPTARPARLSWEGPIAATSIDHLSVYELTIEDRTVFGRRVRDGELVPRTDDDLLALYTRTHDALAAAGFEHYEISSYARPGKRAVHNSLYWRGNAFLGLGVGAASLELRADGSGVRATNPRRAVDYLAKVAPEAITSDPDELARDRAWLGMRTRDGVAEAELPPGLGARLVDQGLAERVGGRISPTLRGFLMADAIAALIV